MDRVNFKYHYIACFKDHISRPQIDKKASRLLCKFTINIKFVTSKAKSSDIGVKWKWSERSVFSLHHV